MSPQLISPEEAWSRLDEAITPLPGLLVARRNSWRRVLAQALTARVDVPGQDVSAMDGYAVGPGPLPERLPVAGSVAAGDRPGAQITPGTALRIMTGAPVPEGADRIIPFEATDSGTEEVVIHSATSSGAHIRREGEVVRRGDALLAAGTPVSAPTLATLATHGISTLEVHRPPAVAVVTTGDEVVPPSIDPAPGQLRDSHTDFLLTAGRELALEFDSLGIASDDPEALAERLSSGMGSDVLIVGGGVSKGAYDYVDSTLASCGCEKLFHNVAIQPGKPLLAARHPGGLVFGLPGNPNAVIVTYYLFVRPALQRLMGYSAGFWQGARRGRLTDSLPGAKGRDRFIPGTAVRAGEEDLLQPISARGSHDMNALASANALIRVRAESSPLDAGERCEWLALPG